MNEPLRVAVLGNTDPAVYWSTENEYLDAWERAGHRPHRYHENNPADWVVLETLVAAGEYDLVQWTSTQAFRLNVGNDLQYRLALACKKARVPLIGVHLDRWWGLKTANREQQLEQPYFNVVDVMFTADGAHDDEWKAMGVDHQWLLPAISERWLGLGEVKPEYECDVVFVGGWYDYGHREWKHRHELIAFLSQTYGDRFLALPRKNSPRIVGRDLNDVYASAKVVIGDSCLSPKVDGSPMTKYVSDRCFESTGRGACFVHPHVEGVTDGPLVAGVHLKCWDLGDWAGLRSTIDELLANPHRRSQLSQEALSNAGSFHTYTRRVGEIVAQLNARGLLHHGV